MVQNPFIGCLQGGEDRVLDRKKIDEAVRRAGNALREGTIRTKGEAKHVKFFLTNAQNSLDSAESLLEHTENGDYNGSLWVINASYYSMFYTVRALLESARIKLGSDLSIHALAFDALVYFFHETKKLEKRLCEMFSEAQRKNCTL